MRPQRAKVIKLALTHDVGSGESSTNKDGGPVGNGPDL